MKKCRTPLLGPEQACATWRDSCYPPPITGRQWKISYRQPASLIFACALGLCVLAPEAFAANSGGEEKILWTSVNAFVGNNGTGSGNTVFFDDNDDLYDAVIGGYVDSDGTASGNTVTVFGDQDTELYFGNIVAGGYVDGDGTANNNTVSITGSVVVDGDVLGDATGVYVEDYVYGGLVYGDGTASGNSVSLTALVAVAGNVEGDVYGVETNYDIYGGYVDGDGEANNNSVIINSAVAVGEDVEGDVYGVYTSYGIYSGYVYGEGTASNNTVTINSAVAVAGTVASSGYIEGVYVDDYVAGGYVDEAGTANNNSVSITSSVAVGGDVDGDVYAVYVDEEIYGGYVYSDGTASGNSVSLAGSVDVGGDVDGDVSGVFANYSIYGGYVYGEGTASNNTVTINSAVAVAGTVASSGYIEGVYVDDYVAGGYVDDDGTANNNSVSITSSVAVGEDVDGDVYGVYVDEEIYGGYVYGDGTAFGNSVSIDGSVYVGGDVSGYAYGVYLDYDIYGGYVDGDGEASGNSVSLTGSVDVGGDVIGEATGVYVEDYVYGGYVGGEGIASNNTVSLIGSMYVASDVSGEAYGVYVDEEIYGGHVDGEGTANNNSVIIDGSVYVGGDVYGGYVDENGEANNNSVTLFGAPTFGSSSMLYGGYVGGSEAISSGNTLNVFTKGIVVADIDSFQNYNFALYKDELVTALTLVDGNDTYLGDGEVKITRVLDRVLSRADVIPVGTEITLLESESGTLDVSDLTLNSGKVYQGLALRYDYELDLVLNADDDPTAIIATVTSAGVNPLAKTVSEATAASVGFVNQSADLVAGAGLNNAMAATKSASGGSGGLGLMPFVAAAGSSSSYDTGSYVDVDGFAFMTGLAKRWETPTTNVVVGPFFEAAWGDYTSYNSADGETVKGQGDTRTVGGGLLARMDLTGTDMKGLYTEGSVRAGSLTYDYTSDFFDNITGAAASYKRSNAYYGLHAGLGHICNVNEKATMDVYGKLFWTHVDGKSVDVLGDRFELEDSDSLRTRLGARFNYAVSERVIPYVGAAWEHEFDGDANATTYGFDVSAPSLKGSSGMAELGLTWKPEVDNRMSINLGAQGYAGTREGITGSLQLKFEF